MLLKVEKEITGCPECPFYDCHKDLNGAIGMRSVCTENKVSVFVPMIDGMIDSDSHLWRLQAQCPHIDWTPVLKINLEEE